MRGTAWSSGSGNNRAETPESTILLVDVDRYLAYKGPRALPGRRLNIVMDVAVIAAYNAGVERSQAPPKFRVETPGGVAVARTAIVQPLHDGLDHVFLPSIETDPYCQELVSGSNRLLFRGAELGQFFNYMEERDSAHKGIAAVARLALNHAP